MATIRSAGGAQSSAGGPRDGTDLLDRHVKREHIPAVVRRPTGTLGNRSLYNLACEGRHVEVRTAVEAMFDLRRVQP